MAPGTGRMMLVGFGGVMAAVALFGPLRTYVMCVSPPFEPAACPLEADMRAQKQRERSWWILFCLLVAGCCWVAAFRT